MTAEVRHNFKGSAWLLADMSLNIWALSIVKATGLDYPPVQLVFFRALTGFILLTPWIIKHRHAFKTVDHKSLHVARIVLSSVALSAGFFAIARVPFALFTAVNFTRPLLMIVMAALILKEHVEPRKWGAAGVALLGVLIAVSPAGLVANAGLPVLFLAVVAGTGAIILTRKLRDTPHILMMTFYTGGLTLVTAPIVYLTWVPVASDAILPILAIGVFTQCAQACFLRAHYFGQAGFLAIIGYLSLVLSAGVGYFVFGERLTIPFCIGAALVIAAAIWVVRSEPKPAT